MKLILFYSVLAQLLWQCQSLTYCTYKYYDVNYNLRRRTYTCSSREYCCGTRSCCTVVYARWYLWFVLSSFFLIMFIIWWYYRYRYAPRRRLMLTTAPMAATTTTVTYPPPQQPMAAPGMYPAPGGFQAQGGYPPPGYSMPQGGGGAIFMAPSQGVVHYNNKVGYPHGPPPPYTQTAPTNGVP